MSNDTERGITRRQAIAAGIAGASAATLVAAAGHTGAAPAPGASDEAKTGAQARLPVIYLPHGGGPWPFVDLGFGEKREMDALAGYLRGLPAGLPDAPRALLVISAHWEQPVPTVMSAAHPPMLYDYYGFPPESYAIQWPAPGEPALAARTRKLLENAGFETADEPRRGFDHGTFVPLKVAWPDADVPTVQLSLKQGLDPAEHLAMGRALAPLRDEGVLIVGSGMSYHNLRAFFGGAGRETSATFDAWLQAAATAAPAARAEALTAWAKAPAARASHPREEHLLPLMVVAGAAGADVGRTAYSDTFAGARISAFHFG